MLKSTHPTATATGTRRTSPRLSSWGDSTICLAAKAKGDETRGEITVLATAKDLVKDNDFSGLFEHFHGGETGSEAGFEDDELMMK